MHIGLIISLIKELWVKEVHVLYLSPLLAQENTDVVLGIVVNMLAFYSEDLSLNPAEVQRLNAKMLFEKNESRDTNILPVWLI